MMKLMDGQHQDTGAEPEPPREVAGDGDGRVPGVTTEFPWPSERERRGLRMIRTGNVSSMSDANAADLWIDRILGVRSDLPDAIECPTCIGHGRIRDGETRELRKCLDCNGSGERTP